MATKAKVVTGTLGSAVSSTLDLTSSGFGTPDAFLVFANHAAGATQPQDNAEFVAGFWDGTTAYSMGITSEDAATTTDTGRSFEVGKILVCPTFSTTRRYDATLSTVTDGVRLTTTDDSFYGDLSVMGVLLGGLTNAQGGHFNVSASTPVNVSLGFTPDVVIMLANSSTDTGTTSNDTYSTITMGVTHRDGLGTYHNATISYASDHGVTTTRNNTHVRNDQTLASVYGDSNNWSIKVNNFSSGFDVVHGVSPSGRKVFYLALQLADPDDFGLDIFDTQTSTGSYENSNFAFTPDAILLMGGQDTAVNTVYGKATIFVGGADGTTERAIGATDQDGVTTTNTSCFSQANVLALKNDDGTDDATASLTSLDADGFTLNYTDAATSASKVIAFAFGDSTGGGGVTGSLSVQESGSDTASITGSLVVSGDVSAQESGSDTASIAGSVLVSGSLAVQESGSDIATISGTGTTTGNLSVQESGPDVAAIAGSVLVSGDISAVESGSDTASISGAVLVTGDLSVQESGSDIAAIFGGGAVPVTGDLSAQEVGSDSASIAGAVVVTGNFASQESSTDSVLISGNVFVVGNLAVQETGTDYIAISSAAPVVLLRPRQRRGLQVYSRRPKQVQ